MSKKGGGKQTSVSEPWGAAQPYLTDVMGMAQSAAKNSPQYYSGSTTVGALPSEQAAWQQMFDFSNKTFGQGGQYDQANQALSGLMQGGSGTGSMANAFNGTATQQLGNAFGMAPDFSRYNINGPTAGGGNSASAFGNYGFDFGGAPQLGVAGNLDARGAISSMLSGTPDYESAQGAVDAANAPLMREFEQEVLPGLNSRATFLNNPTGGIKTLGKVLPELGSRMSQNAQSIMEGERQRALGAQRDAAGLVTQGGLASAGLGLDATRAASNFALGSDAARAGAMQSDAQLGLQSDMAKSNFALDRANSQTGAEGDWRSQLLNFGNLAGNLGSQNANTMLSALGMVPGMTQLGQLPGQISGQYGAWQRGLAENDLSANLDRWNFEQNLPWQQAQNYASILGGMGGQGGTTTQTGGGGSSLAGGMGGALMGSQIGGGIGKGYPGLGALFGGLAGMFG